VYRSYELLKLLAERVSIGVAFTNVKVAADKISKQQRTDIIIFFNELPSYRAILQHCYLVYPK